MAGKKLMKEFMGQMAEVVNVGLTKQPTVINVNVPAPRVTISSAEVSMRPQIKVNVPEVEEQVVHTVRPPQGDRRVIVSHSDGTESSFTIKATDPAIPEDSTR